MQYKGYEAVIEQDENDRLFFGRVINIEDIIVFDGLSVDKLEQL
jgi:predicted HicB family RNase H-like nuclease